MGLPTVAIVGRPNVGKSSLFNWLAGKRIAIVEPTAGVTRDRMSYPVQGEERIFDLVDTGGIGVHDMDDLTEDIERQIDHAIHEADVIVYVVDVRDGVTPLDEMVAERLRPLQKKVICVANKCDFEGIETQATDFFRLGYGSPICVSAQGNRNKKELLKKIENDLPDGPLETIEEPVLKVAIVGRRNVGKSTFINQLAQQERVIVSEIAGTTRDSIDVRFEKDGKVIIAIDTAGVRRRGSIANDIEWYSMARAERSIRRADVVLHFHDPQMTVSKVDKQLATYILENHKPAVFVVNKWDLMKSQLVTGEFADYLQKVFPSLKFVPFAFITAKSGKNVQAVLDLAQTLHKQASSRVSTGDLNRVLREALEQREPRIKHNRRPKVFFATQVATNPPTIVLFTNGPELFDNTYQRYLLTQFRENLPFTEVPIKLVLRNRHGEVFKHPDVDPEVPLEHLTDTTELHPEVQALDESKEPPKRRARKKPKGQSNSGLWTDV
ncbi:MAG: ribosome biogenesis GTPase Der [Gemmataceae bacterium]